MAIMAQWNNKSWEVSRKKIAALNGISASVKLQTENNSDAAGSPATKTKALELQNLSFDFTLGSAAGVDVRSEYESWIALLGETAPFFLGGRRFGPANVMLTGVSLDNTVLDDYGRILKGTIAISLTESSEEASSKKAGPANKAKKSSAAGVSTGTGPRLSAVNVSAPSADKAKLKPSNTQLSK